MPSSFRPIACLRGMPLLWLLLASCLAALLSAAAGQTGMSATSSPSSATALVSYSVTATSTQSSDSAVAASSPTGPPMASPTSSASSANTSPFSSPAVFATSVSSSPISAVPTAPTLSPTSSVVTSSPLSLSSSSSSSSSSVTKSSSSTSAPIPSSSSSSAAKHSSSSLSSSSAATSVRSYSTSSSSSSSLRTSSPAPALASTTTPHVTSSTTSSSVHTTTQSSSPTSPANPLLVTASVGAIQGYHDSGTNTSRFNNIPYGVAPVGALRFLPPRPLASLPYSPFNATSHSLTACVQPGSSTQYAGQEDCLTLSVTAPNPMPASGAKLPVVVYFCGGGFSTCVNEDAGTWLRQSQSFLFVNVQYRLGAFGFLSLAELSAVQSPISYSGNQGLQDQQAALRWVQANIAAFGGDPTKVTLQGQSAGAFSVCCHLLMPGSAGLFRGAILESGGCEASKPQGVWTLSDQEAYFKQYLVGPSSCASQTGAQLVSCLQALSASQVYSLYLNTPNTPNSYLAHHAFVPILDGVVLPDTPHNLLTSRTRHNNASVLLGSGTGEMVTWYLNKGPPTNANDSPYGYTQSTIDAQLGYESGSNNTIKAYYQQANYQHTHPTLSAFMSDINHVYIYGFSAMAYQCPSRRVASAMARGGAAVYQYSWNYLQAVSTAWTGLAAHGAELPLVFGSTSSAEDKVMSAQTRNYWHRFIAYADPNHADPTIDRAYSAVYGSNTLVSWPRFDPDGSDLTMTMSNGTVAKHFATQAAVHREVCEPLWDDVVPQPLVVARRTQCTADQCSTQESAANQCVDNYNSTYYCKCASPVWKPTPGSQACYKVSSSSASTTAAVKRSSSSSTAAGSPKHSSSSTSAPAAAPALSSAQLTVCSYTIYFPKGEAGCLNDTITGYLSYSPSAPVAANSVYPSYPTAYLLRSLNGTRTLSFATYTQRFSIVALSAVAKPGTVQTQQGATYTNLFYPAAKGYIDPSGWQFSQSNGTMSYVKLFAGANNPNASNNLQDQSLTYLPAGHTTRGTSGAFSRLSCKLGAQP